MTNRDVQVRSTRLKKRFALVAGGIIVLASCATVRYYWNTESAHAQAVFQRKSTSRSKAPKKFSSRNPLKFKFPSKKSPTTASAARAAKPAPIKNQPKIVAVVNREDISRQELAREATRRHGKNVLKSLISKHLILQACKKYNIVITEKDVTEEIAGMAEKFKITKEQLALIQQEKGITPDQYRNNVIWPLLALRRLAGKEIQVSEEEISRVWQSRFGPKVQTRMIVVTDLKKANRLHALAVANPQQFGNLAKNESEDSRSASARGWIPPIRRHMGDAKIEQVAFALKPGEVSPVITLSGRYLILKCEKRLPGTEVGLGYIKGIKRQIHDQIRDKKMPKLATRILEKLQEQSTIINVYNHPEKKKSMPGIVAVVNDQKVTFRQLAEECIARHGKEVLQGEINRKLLNGELARRKLKVTEQEIDAEIARAAAMYGFINQDGTANVSAWLKNKTDEDDTTIELYLSDSVWPSVALQKLVESKVEVTSEDLQKAYQSNYGERVKVLAIVLGSQRQAHEVFEYARTTPTDEYFGRLANEYSIEQASKANFGKVPAIRRYSGQPQMEKEAFQLQADPNNPLAALSGVISIGDKFILLRCLGRSHPEDSPEFADVKEDLHKDIHEKKLRIAMTKQFDSLKESAQIDNFLAGTSQAGKKPGSRNKAIGRSGTRPRFSKAIRPVTNITPRTSSPGR